MADVIRGGGDAGVNKPGALPGVSEHNVTPAVTDGRDPMPTSKHVPGLCGHRTGHGPFRAHPSHLVGMCAWGHRAPFVQPRTSPRNRSLLRLTVVVLGSTVTHCTGLQPRNRTAQPRHAAPGSDRDGTTAFRNRAAQQDSTVNGMRLNHPETSPCTPITGKLSSTEPVPGPKRLGTAGPGLLGSRKCALRGSQDAAIAH